MALSKKEKQEIINKFQISEKDNGSVEVQIALMSAKINKLIEHLKQHKHDISSRRGLLNLVGQRRRYFKYLSIHNPKQVEKLKKDLNL